MWILLPCEFYKISNLLTSGNPFNHEDQNIFFQKYFSLHNHPDLKIYLDFRDLE